jgi:hypothetical protein
MIDKRIFSVAEANALIPALEVHFGHLLQLRTQLRMTFAELSALGEPPTVASLERTDHPLSVRKLNGRFQALMEALTETLRQVEILGAAVKDLDLGLCDFLGEKDGRAVWLCWQFGEKEISHYHALDAGFSARRPLEEGAKSIVRIMH